MTGSVWTARSPFVQESPAVRPQGPAHLSPTSVWSSGLPWQVAVGTPGLCRGPVPVSALSSSKPPTDITAAATVSAEPYRTPEAFSGSACRAPRGRSSLWSEQPPGAGLLCSGATSPAGLCQRVPRLTPLQPLCLRLWNS